MIYLGLPETGALCFCDFIKGETSITVCKVGLNLINISIYLYLEILFNYSNIIIQSTFIGLNRDLHIF